MADFALDAFNQRDFWVTEAVPGFARLAYDQRKSLWGKLVSPFHQAVLRLRIQHTFSAQHGLVLAIGGSRHGDISQNSPMPFVPSRKRACVAGLWANASAPPVIMGPAGG